MSNMSHHKLNHANEHKDSWHSGSNISAWGTRKRRKFFQHAIYRYGKHKNTVLIRALLNPLHKYIGDKHQVTHRNMGV